MFFFFFFFLLLFTPRVELADFVRIKQASHGPAVSSTFKIAILSSLCRRWTGLRRNTTS